MAVLVITYVVCDYPEGICSSKHRQFIDPGYSVTIWPINGGGMIYYLERY